MAIQLFGEQSTHQQSKLLMSEGSGYIKRLCDLVARKAGPVGQGGCGPCQAALCCVSGAGALSKANAELWTQTPHLEAVQSCSPSWGFSRPLQSVTQVAILGPRLPASVLTTGPGSRTGGRASFVIARKSLGTEAGFHLPPSGVIVSAKCLSSTAMITRLHFLAVVTGFFLLSKY